MCKIASENKNKCILELQDVTYCYEGEKLPVWKNLSCRFFEGKIHAISGASGCGKSSILYLLNGLIPHMYEGNLEGRVLLDGEEITDMLPRHRCEKIGFVMQNPESQFCTFTVEEELAFGMENLSVNVEEMERRIKDTLAYVGMSGYEKCDLNQLSGGQKQKIAIASILVTQPGILLLDEPTANLDPKSRRQIFQLIVRLSRERHMTIILVEHNIGEILQEVDWLTTLDSGGNVILSGEVKEVGEKFLKKLSRQENAGQPEDLAAKETILSIDNLEFTYPEPGQKKREKKQGKKIVDHLSMKVNRQDFLAVVGENGVGKTTLMRLIFRICVQDAGRIELFGRPVESYRKKELYRLIGLVFQNPESQFITNTVYDEMMFSLKRVKITQEEKEARVQAMLEQFHLEQEKEKSPFVLSQGQKRRLSVASMLLTNQKIVFLDEPTYGQDAENRHELMKDMQQLIRKGITIVMITHDLELVRQYATKVVEIEEGRVKYALPMKEYFRRREGEE